MRTLKSDRHSKQNVVRSKRPTIGNSNKSDDKTATSKTQSTKYKKCTHCGRTNHATKGCWFNPENKGKAKPGKKNVSQTDRAIMMTQEQFNAILERFPRHAKSGTRKVCDLSPEESDAEIVNMFSLKATICRVDTKDDSDESSIYFDLLSSEIMPSKDNNNSKERKQITKPPKLWAK